MNSIYYANGSLHVEGFDVGEVADQFSTPLYIYSATEILGKFNEYRNAIQVSNIMWVVLAAVRSKKIAIECKSGWWWSYFLALLTFS